MMVQPSRYSAIHSPTSVSPNGYFAKYGANTFGRDFVVGDIHGEFSKLSKLLSCAEFNEGTDRLFAVGDLVDRGQESRQVGHWLNKPWFKSVMGNHDYWCVEGGQGTEPAGHRRYGGEWFYSLTSEEQRTIGHALHALPIAIQVDGRNGEKFGIVHAECTCLSWSRFEEALSGELGDSYRDYHATNAMWRRSRHANQTTIPVAGIDRIYVGHTKVHAVLDFGNVRYIDTGGVFKDGLLTMVEVGGLEAVHSI
ncbi:metallophosphoesterase [Pseudomonas aeruginosa]|uniref:metallophosphoesterase n=1 Tax=Pseudomonas aeruginosa TaxID=287 RepID=UPI0009A30627|nr:metallophosphoesterase [Pseudomonas aeruginosa]